MSNPLNRLRVWFWTQVNDFTSHLADRRRETRRELANVYNRKVLGAVLVSSSFFKIIESFKVIDPWSIAYWIVVFIIANYVFVKWEAVSESVDDTIQKADEKAEEASDGDGSEG